MFVFMTALKTAAVVSMTEPVPLPPPLLLTTECSHPHTLYCSLPNTQTAQAFHWSVWVSLGATAIAVSVIITVAELLAGGERSNRKGLRGWSWYCMTKMVQVRLVRSDDWGRSRV